jgi:hypothetical protein
VKIYTCSLIKNEKTSECGAKKSLIGRVGQKNAILCRKSQNPNIWSSLSFELFSLKNLHEIWKTKGLRGI